MFTELLQLSMLEIFFCLVVIFIAYAVKGLSGFGSGLVAIPLLAFMFPLTLVVPVLGLLSYSGTIMQSYSFRKDVSWPDLWPLIPFSLLGITLAIWLLVNIEANILVRSLGIFVLCYSIYSLLLISTTNGTRLWAIPAGSFGGLVGALFGTGGPFYVLYLRLRQLDKTVFRATIAMAFLLDGGFRVVGYAISGLYTSQVLMLTLILFPMLLLGMFAGHRVHIKISRQRFNQVISILLMFSGIVLILKSFGG